MGETGVFRLTENGSGRIVTGETGLAHTRTGIQSVADLEESVPCSIRATRGWSGDIVGMTSSS